MCLYMTIKISIFKYMKINKQLFNEDYDIHTTMVGDHNKFLYLNQERNKIVITPIPGLSTHCMEGLMSPTIEWSKI